MYSWFVPANRLYDIESRTPIAHPAHQATDADVRRALENREVRADGGYSLSDIDQSPSLVRAFSSYSRATSESISSNTVPPHEHPLGLPMGSSVPSDFSLAAYGSSQSTHIAIPRFSPSSRLICSDWASSKDKQDGACQRLSQKHSLQPGTDREDGGLR